MTGDGKVSRGERYGKNLRNTSNAATEICRDSLLLNSRPLGTLSTVSHAKHQNRIRTYIYNVTEMMALHSTTAILGVSRPDLGFASSLFGSTSHSEDRAICRILIDFRALSCASIQR